LLLLNVDFNDSPACILAFVVTAALLGEVKEAWAWKDGPNAEDVPEGKKEI